MTTFDTFFSPQKLERILFGYIPEEPEETINAVRDIVTHNASDESGRLKRRLKQNASLMLEEYVEDVFEYYKTHNELVEGLHGKDGQTWLEMLHVIRRSVRGRLSTLGIKLSSSGSAWAEDIVQTVAIELFQTNYPFDVDLLPWILRLTQNTTNRFYRDIIRPSREFDVDDFEEFDIETKQFRRDDEWISSVELRLDVNQMIEKLGTKHRQEFARLLYQEGLDYDDIAEKMSRSKNTLYKLRSDTDNELRKIFQSEWYN